MQLDVGYNPFVVYNMARRIQHHDNESFVYYEIALSLFDAPVVEWITTFTIDIDIDTHRNMLE